MSFKRLENGVGLPSYLRLDVTIKVTKKGSCFFLLYVSLCIFPLSFSFSSLSLPLIIHVHACTYTSLPVCMCVPTPVCLSICFSLFWFCPLIRLPSLSLHVSLPPSCVCLWSSSPSSIVCQKSEREKRAPWLSSASLSSLSISPRTWVHITALPHNTLQPEFWGPRVSPKHKGSTPKLLMDLVGPSLFLRKLQCFHWDFPDGSVVKNLPMQETQVRSPDREDPLEKEMATHSSYSCLGTPVARGTRQATDPGVSETEQLSINK